MLRADQEAQWEETLRKAEAFLALGEEEGNRLIEAAIARGNFQSAVGVCESVRAIARDCGLVREEGNLDPTVLLIRAVNEQTGREVRIVLREDRVFVLPDASQSR
jgi:hypothetical protein